MSKLTQCASTKMVLWKGAYNILYWWFKVESGLEMVRFSGIATQSVYD